MNKVYSKIDKYKLDTMQKIARG